MNSIIENILTRRSIRTFRETQISEEDLNTILTAGSYAPNGMGTQSWKFTAIQNTSVLEKVNEAIRLTLISIPVVAETHPYVVSLIEKAKDKSSNFLYHAPTLIIVSNLKDNGNSMPDSAHSLGIGSCWLNQLPGLTHMPLIRELLSDLDVPVNHIVYGSVVMGYAAEEPKQAAPRKNVVNIIR
jgi:nitroreductase